MAGEPDTGSLFNFNASTYTADVQPDGSLSTFLKSVPVSRHITPALLGNGARVALLIMDDNNPQDCWVVGVLASGSPIIPAATAALVHNSAATISIPNATQTTLSFNTRDFDTRFDAGLTPFWTAGAPTILAITSPGIYEGWLNVEWNTNAAGERALTIFDSVANQFIGINEIAPLAGDTTNMIVSTGPRKITAPTNWSAMVAQSSGGALNILFDGGNSPYFGIKQLG